MTVDKTCKDGKRWNKSQRFELVFVLSRFVGNSTIGSFATFRTSTEAVWLLSIPVPSIQSQSQPLIVVLLTTSLQSSQLSPGNSPLQHRPGRHAGRVECRCRTGGIGDGDEVWRGSGIVEPATPGADVTSVYLGIAHVTEAAGLLDAIVQSVLLSSSDFIQSFADQEVITA